MFRTILCAVIVAVAAYAQWDPLEPVPDFVQVGTGAAITYSYDQWGARGYDTVWGIFPTWESLETYFLYYDCSEGHWHQPDDYVVAYEWLENTAITFQWMEGGVVFVVGKEAGEATLYRYDVKDGEWDDELIEEFDLRDGASIAFRANPNYNVQLQPIPGWLYCLPGDDTAFWRYWIESSLEPVAVDGIYPPEGSLIADQTPVFIWEDSPDAISYRLVVAQDPEFSNVVLDVITPIPQYQVETKMANSIYYWKTACQSSNGEWSWSDVHSFTLQGGWERLRSIPTWVGEGAALAYERDYYDNRECLVALVGDGGNDYYRYNIGANTWSSLHSTPPPQNVGSALATHRKPTLLNPILPWAIFGQDASEYPWFHRYPHFGWQQDTRRLPLPLGPGASLAASKGFYSHGEWFNYEYLIVGEDESGNPRNDFYRLRVSLGPGEVNRVSGPQTEENLPGCWASVRVNSGAVVVEYQLDGEANVKASVFDATGRVVSRLYSGPQPAGAHRLSFSPDASGAYFILLDTGREQAKLKVVVR